MGHIFFAIIFRPTSLIIFRITLVGQLLTIVFWDRCRPTFIGHCSVTIVNQLSLIIVESFSLNVFWRPLPVNFHRPFFDNTCWPTTDNHYSLVVWLTIFRWTLLANFCCMLFGDHCRLTFVNVFVWSFCQLTLVYCFSMIITS